jgi:hypothetical protein
LLIVHNGKSKYTIISTVAELQKRKEKRVYKAVKFSPAWVVFNVKDVLGHKMELIDRIRDGVKKAD